MYNKLFEIHGSHQRWFNKDMTDSHRWLVRLIQSESVQLIHSKEPHQSAYVRELGIYPMQAHNSSKTKKSEKLLDFKDF